MSPNHLKFSRSLFTAILSGALILGAVPIAASSAAASPGGPDSTPTDAVEASRGDDAHLPPPTDGVPEGLKARPYSVEGPVAPSDLVGEEDVNAVDVAAQATIRGTVTDSTGTPVSGAMVYATGYVGDIPVAPVFSSATAADGTYELVVSDPAGVDSWGVQFTADGYEDQFWSGLSRYYLPDPIELGDGSVVESIDATLYRSGTATATVVGVPSGHVEGYLYVYDSVEADWVWVDTTMFVSSLEFEFDVHPGEYLIGAYYEGQRGIGFGYSEVFQIDEDEQLAVDVELADFVTSPDKDFSGDWISDVLAITSTGSMRMYRSDGMGGWGGASTIGSGWSGFNTVFQVGDFSGDGSTDVIARQASTGNLYLYRGNARGGWSGAVRIGTGWSSFTSIFAPGDFDGDGNVDVMARTSAGTLYLYRGNGTGGWLPRRTIGSGWHVFNAVIGPGDFDGDGKVDVIARDPYGRLFLYPGNGTGGWLPKRQVGTGWQGFTALLGAGDIWGHDKAPDLVVRDAVGRLLVYPGNGSGGWLPKRQIGTGWNGLRILG